MSNLKMRTNTIGGIIAVLISVFGALKILGTLQISWLWVLSPLWMPLLAIALMVLIHGVSTLIALIFTDIDR